MTTPFQLAVCAEMLWLDQPIEWRVARLTERGLGVGLWRWTDHDISQLEGIGANFSIMNGFLEGHLCDDDGAERLLKSAQEAIRVGKRLQVDRLNITGASLGAGGIPTWTLDTDSDAHWQNALDTLDRLCDLAEGESVVFTLENLNQLDHPRCPLSTTGEVLALVSSINRPQLKINLDLYHTQIGEGDLTRWCEKCLPWIGEIQVADNPGRLEPGSGEINYPMIAKSLDAKGYKGTITMEALASGDSDVAIDRFCEAFSST